MISFLELRLIDLIDIFMVAFLMYQVYRLIKGTIAVNILISIFVFILFWLLIKAFKMELSASILDNFVNIGLLALIIVFQQEIRRFFLLIGSKYNLSKRFGLLSLLEDQTETNKSFIKPVVRACESLSKSKTGALIVFTRKSELKDYLASGEALQATISTQLMESIFFKNSPLHDGAVIVGKNQILAAACILPVSQSFDLPKSFGLRHRAALGITETTDAAAVVVSEESGTITFVQHGQIHHGISIEELSNYLEKI